MCSLDGKTVKRDFGGSPKVGQKRYRKVEKLFCEFKK
jgi:hypothetical protein